jgi:hypothetical protein
MGESGVLKAQKKIRRLKLGAQFLSALTREGHGARDKGLRTTRHSPICYSLTVPLKMCPEFLEATEKKPCEKRGGSMWRLLLAFRRAFCGV